MDIDQFYNEHQVTVKGSGIPKPIFAFEEGGFPGKFLFQFFFLKPKEKVFASNVLCRG